MTPTHIAQVLRASKPIVRGGYFEEFTKGELQGWQLTCIEFAVALEQDETIKKFDRTAFLTQCGYRESKE